MTHTPNELHEQFPERADRIHQLRRSDAHFTRISDEYHELNRQIHRIETGVEPADDFRLETLKKQRLALLDQVAGLLHG